MFAVPCLNAINSFSRCSSAQRFCSATTRSTKTSGDSSLLVHQEKSSQCRTLLTGLMILSGFKFTNNLLQWIISYQHLAEYLSISLISTKSSRRYLTQQLRMRSHYLANGTQSLIVCKRCSYSRQSDLTRLLWQSKITLLSRLVNNTLNLQHSDLPTVTEIHPM